MGSPLGHLSSALPLLFYGLWWTFLSCLMHFKDMDLQKRIRGPRAHCVNPQEVTGYITKGRSWLPQPCRPQFPLEPTIRLLLTGFGIFSDLSLQAEGGQIHFKTYSVEFNEDGQLVSHIVQFPHVILHLGFFVSGVVDIASFFINLPPHTSHAFFSLAFLCEGTEFVFHIQGRGYMGSYTHEPIVYLAFICAMLAVVRAFDEKKFAVNIALSSCILLQGTWFLQVGFLMFPPDRVKWILPCPEVPSSIKWRVKTESDFKEYLATQIEDSDKVAHCAAVGHDDNTALLVSFCLAVHILAVAVFILLLAYVMQLMVMKRWLHGRCFRRHSSRCKNISIQTCNSVNSEVSANEAGPGFHN